MILQQLREQTASHHKDLEESALLRHFSDRSITRPLYEKILSKFYGYFSPLEKELQQLQQLPFYLSDYSSRRKASSLQHDLTFFGSAPPELCADLPSISSLDKAFGCLYVMEGSTLGAKVISNVIQYSLGINASNGGSYFHGYGVQTGEYWKNFCSSLQHYAQTEGNSEEIIESANQTFMKLKGWLDQE